MRVGDVEASLAKQFIDRARIGFSVSRRTTDKDIQGTLPLPSDWMTFLDEEQVTSF